MNQREVRSLDNVWHCYFVLKRPTARRPWLDCIMCYSPKHAMIILCFVIVIVIRSKYKVGGKLQYIVQYTQGSKNEMVILLKIYCLKKQSITMNFFGKYILQKKPFLLFFTPQSVAQIDQHRKRHMPKYFKKNYQVIVTKCTYVII